MTGPYPESKNNTILITGTSLNKPPADMLAMHVPRLEIIGPVAIHDAACAVCRRNKAVYDLNRGVLGPCWFCQDAGWSLRSPSQEAHWWVVRFWLILANVLQLIVIICMLWVKE